MNRTGVPFLETHGLRRNRTLSKLYCNNIDMHNVLSQQMSMWPSSLEEVKKSPQKKEYLIFSYVINILCLDYYNNSFL